MRRLLDKLIRTLAMYCKYFKIIKKIYFYALQFSTFSIDLFSLEFFIKIFLHTNLLVNYLFFNAKKKNNIIIIRLS